MKNSEVAEVLYEIAQLLSLGDESVFRIRAYERAAQVVEALTTAIEDIAQQDKLSDIPGIGEGIAEKIREYLHAGKLPYLEELKSKFPPGVLDVMAIPGMGPKKAKLLFTKLGIAGRDDLRKAAETGKLRKLPGFGEKTESNILKGIALVEKAGRRMLLSEALPLAHELLRQLSSNKAVADVSTAGSLRRYRETIGDIDLLCSADRKDRDAVIGHFVHLPSVQRVIAQGETKISVITAPGRQIDLRIADKNCFGAALQYFTGSKAHNVALRGLARRKGFTINEYGIFKLTNKKKPVACRTENDIYATLGLPFIHPLLREDRGEIEAAKKNGLPKLVELRDIKGDFHVHSNYSDGLNTIEEMALRARSLGYEWVVMCDHSRSLKIAHGLSIERLHRKIEEIRALNKKYRDFHILCGVEIDILEHGNLDYPNSVLEELDFVLASIHTGFKQPEEKLTHRIVRALENPHVHCIGHPTGRLLNKRDPYAVNMEAVLRTAADNGKLLEINAFPDRLDLDDVSCRKAKEMGIRLAIGTDSHAVDHLGNMGLGVAVAQRGWLEKKDVLNTLTYEELKTYLKKARKETAGIAR